jgi:hypothetical protein
MKFLKEKLLEKIKLYSGWLSEKSWEEILAYILVIPIWLPIIVGSLGLLFLIFLVLGGWLTS